MKELTDAYLLTVAEISATLIGLLVVGMYYYLETGLRHLTLTRDLVEPVIRGMSKQMFLLFALSLGLSISLVGMTPGWTRALAIVVGIYLFISTVQFSIHIRNQLRVFKSRSFFWYAVSMWIWTIFILAVPWILGGWSPSRSDYGWMIFLSGLLGFMNAIGLLLSSFELRRQDEELAALQEEER